MTFVALRFNNTIASDSSQSVTDRLLSEANQAIGLLDYQSLDPSFPFHLQSILRPIVFSLLLLLLQLTTEMMGYRGGKALFPAHRLYIPFTRLFN